MEYISELAHTTAPAVPHKEGPPRPMAALVLYLSRTTGHNANRLALYLGLGSHTAAFGQSSPAHYGWSLPVAPPLRFGRSAGRDTSSPL